MARQLSMVFMNPVPGRDDDFNTWFDQYLGEAVAKVPHVVSGRRYRFSPMQREGTRPREWEYLALFAIPLWGASRLPERPPWWLRAGSAVGLAVTLLYSVLSVFPIIDVPSWRLFAAKIIGVLVGANLLGLAVYQLAHRRAARHAGRLAPGE